MAEESVSTAKTDPVKMNLFCKATQVAASPDLLAIFRIQKSVKHKLRNKKNNKKTADGNIFEGAVLTAAHTAPHGLDPYLCVLPSFGPRLFEV